MAEEGNKLSLDDVVFYGKKADGTEMLGNDLTKRDLLELRAAMNAWAKKQGYNKLGYKGESVKQFF